MTGCIFRAIAAKGHALLREVFASVIGKAFYEYFLRLLLLRLRSALFELPTFPSAPLARLPEVKKVSGFLRMIYFHFGPDFGNINITHHPMQLSIG